MSENVSGQAVIQQPVLDAVDEGRVNFVQLNKDVRKEFRSALKIRGVGVTVRAPEKPVIIDIDRNSLKMIITDIFTQIERFTADNARAYVEVYQTGRQGCLHCQDSCSGREVIRSSDGSSR